MEHQTIHQQETTENPYEGVNMGHNIKYVRQSRNIYQKQLADLLNLTPRQMSRIEEKAIIEDEELLNKIAAFLNCDINFIKYGKIGEIVKNYNIHNHDNSTVANSAENSHDEIIQPQNNISGEQENNYITNNNCPIEEIKDLFLKVLEEKDKITLHLMDEIKELREDIGKTKK